jgi:hypothetical protein
VKPKDLNPSILEEAVKRKRHVPDRGQRAKQRASRRKRKLRRKKQKDLLKKKPTWQRIHKKHDRDVKKKKGGDVERLNPAQIKFMSKKTYRSSKVQQTRAKAKRNEDMSKLDRVSSLMEEVKDLVGATNTDPYNEAMESFAHLALMAEQLGVGLANLAEHFNDDDIAEVADTYLKLSESAAEVAVYLQENDEVSAGRLQETFQSQAAYLLDGLELLADLTEGNDGSQDYSEDYEDFDEDIEAFDWEAANASLSERLNVVQEYVTTTLSPKAYWLDKMKNSMGFGGGATSDKAQHPEADDDHPGNKPDLLGKVSTQELVLKKNMSKGSY